MGEAMIFIILTLAILGLALIFTEFFFPSGLLGILAALLLLGSVVWFGCLKIGFGWTLLYAFSLVVAAALTCLYALRRVQSRVALKEDQQGFVAAELSSSYVGQVATAASDLKPTGHVVIGQDKFHAMAQVGYISKGTEVKVVEIRGATLIVKKVG